MGSQELELLSNLPIAGGAGIIKKVDKAMDVAKLGRAAEKAAVKATGTTPVDIAHTIGADYNPRTGKVTGGHTLLNDDVRVAQVVSPPDANGVYQAIVEVKTPDGTWQTKTVGATSKPQNNTMFPRDWDVARVQAEIESAWNAADKTIQGTRWSGTSSSGVTIEGYTHPRTTAFPIYSKAIK